MGSAAGFHGPKPPPGPSHRYRFTLSALDRRLALAATPPTGPQCRAKTLQGIAASALRPWSGEA
ncbi:hypothetical protein H6G65_09115 [Microcystis elabens FACHB-917]|nr:hypothetical protein [Microcystis elabens FACHB-917]